MNETKIEWCEKTLNPVVGCSFGCPYCYARRLNTRFKWVEDGDEVQGHGECQIAFDCPHHAP